jgi:hypothetical protein
MAMAIAITITIFFLFFILMMIKRVVVDSQLVLGYLSVKSLLFGWGTFTERRFPVVLPFDESGQTAHPELLSFYIGDWLLFDLIYQRYIGCQATS